MFYEEFFRRLNKNNVDYVVVGGVAVVLHGVVRLTADLDLMVYLEEQNLKKFINIMNKLGYKPKAPVKANDFIDPQIRKQWVEEKNMKVFSFYHPTRPINLIDLFANEPINYLKVKKESVIIKAGNLKIPIVSIKNLIKLKRISGRSQDIADIEALKEILRREKGEQTE